MDLQTLTTIVVGASVSLIYFEAIRPLVRISKQSGVPITELNVVKALSLDVRIKEWSNILPLQDIDDICEYVDARIGPNAVKQVLPILTRKGAPFPSYWDKMRLRSLELRERVAEVYRQPAIVNYLRA